MPFILYSIWHYAGFLVGRRTKIVAGRSRHSVSFLNENPRVKSLAGRSRHRVSIFNQNPHLTLRSRHLTSIFGQIFHFRAIEGDDGRATFGRKRNPMCFQPTKGRSTRAKREKHVSDTRETRERHARNTRATREKHASISGRRLHSTGTFLPFSYETRVLPVPLSRRDEDLAGYVFKMRMSI